MGPKVLSEETGAQLVSNRNSPNYHVIRGCPCYREFGDEKICINEDGLTSIRPIMIDPTLFSQISSYEDLGEYKSDRESMCYLAIILDREENKVYCICKNKPIIINQRYVKASDLDSALRFLELTGETMDDAFCSTCIYKYIITMGDVFEDIFTSDEQDTITVGYIKSIAWEVLKTIGARDSDNDFLGTTKASIQRAVIAFAQQVFEYDMFISINKVSLDSRIVKLVDKLKQLCKYTAMTMFQIESLIELTNKQVTRRQVQYLTETAKIISIIYEESESVMAEFIKNNDFQWQMEKIKGIYQKSPIQNQMKFVSLMKVLSEIGTLMKRESKLSSANRL